MVKFHVPPDHRHDLAYHFQVATRVAHEISATFPPPIELEFEKCYYPYLLFAKKRYSGAMYTTPEAMDYIDTKGLSVVRRDFTPIAKRVSVHVLNALMIDKCPEKAIRDAREEVLNVLCGRVPVDDFVLSKTLRTGYKNDNQPHVAVARKIRQRTGTSPHSGERVPYVFVRDDDNPDGLQVDRAEDPGWAADNSLPLDYLYYIDHQLTSPLVGLLELVVDDPKEAIFGYEPIKKILDDLRGRHTALVKTAKRVRMNAGRNQLEITRFFVPK